ncbi:hypothetical protein WMY93_003333 [Mugilogobius chulae]|uniref:trypsin n=1 Tax=Mugilogobius chulae TaxID=88201 RepID=A0AAW0PZJ8_9GOBI
MASVQFKKKHVCGGFLIQDDFVLTAAHCRRFPEMRVVLGAHNISNEKEKGQQKIQVEKYFKHPNYEVNGKFDFDIMLLKCSVAGWGRTHPYSSASDVLREAEEKILPNSDCEDVWQQYFNTDHMICTKVSTKRGSMCQGDSGGPLICKTSLWVSQHSLDQITVVIQSILMATLIFPVFFHGSKRELQRFLRESEIKRREREERERGRGRERF